MDTQGSSLSPLWKRGSTFFSVSFDLICHRFKLLLDPDTFSKPYIKEMRDWAAKEQTSITMTILAFVILPMYAGPYIRSRLGRIRRDILLQVYGKSSFISKELGVKTTAIPVSELKKRMFK